MDNNNWISVEDGTPENGDDVLVWTSDEYFLMGEFMHRKWNVFPHPYLKPKGEVTHWQPLPSPPNKVSI